MFEQWLHGVIHYIHQHPHIGELFAFLVAFVESLPILGTIIPGSITMTAVGTLIGAGLLPGYFTLFLAAIGALAGDTIGFISGRILKDRIRHLWPFTRWPKLLTASETFFHKHGGKSILIGRFVGAARSAIPLVAGVCRLNWWRFTIAAIPSAVLWAVVYAISGMVLGAFSTQIPPTLLSEYIGIGLAIIVGLWAIFWVIQHFFSRIVQAIATKIQKLWDSLSAHHSTHWLISYLTNRQSPKDHHQLTRLLLALVCAICFIIILISVVTHNVISHVNAPLFHFAQSFRPYPFKAFFVSMTLLAKPVVLGLAGIVIAMGLACLKQWRAACHLALLMLASMAVVYLLKLGIHSPRPTGFMIVAHSNSFPSGHTVMATVLFTFIAMLSADKISKPYRWIAHTLATVLIILVGLSRLYLGAHWFLDVFGGIFLGLTLALLVSIHYHRLPKKTGALSLHTGIWLTWSLSVIAVASAAYGATHYDKATYQYTRRVTHTQITPREWLHNPTTFLPVYRDTRLGNPAEPLNVQWLGSLAAIEKTLQQQHWQLLKRDDYIEDAVKRLATTKPEYHLSFLKLLYRNHRPALILYRQVPGKKWIYLLHLWDAHVHVGQQRLWIGMFNRLIPPHAMITFNHRTLMSFDIHHAKIALLPEHTDWHMQSFLVTGHPLADKPPWYHWDGHILLVFKPHH